MNTLLSFHGDEKLKETMIEEIEKHRKADAIIQGTYGNKDDKEFKGCAVGCSIQSLNKGLDTSDHSIYEKELGIPEWLARLEDKLFEGLPVEESKKWPGDFMQAIPIGVNLEHVKYKFCVFLLKENIDRVLTLKIEDSLKEQVVSAIRDVLTLHENAINTGIWDESAARSAESAAESAARSAASAAWSAAWSAASAARSAAWSAAWSAASAAESAASAAWSAAYIKYAEKLLEMIRKCK